MMFSSSNSNRDSDSFDAQNFLISPSSSQLGSSASLALLQEDQFFVDNFLSPSQGQHQFFLGPEGNPDQLTLIDNHDFADGVMVAGSFDGNQISCDTVVEEEVGPAQKNHKKAIGGSSNNEINEKDCHQPVKRQAKRIRTGKKDRHSKICTAQGPRDRRMRLSLQIARKFFDLQDKLGFDKASKTIEWLFNMSKNAIREVMGNTYSRMDEPNRSYGDGINNNSSDSGWKNHLVSPLSENEDIFCASEFEHITTNQKTYNYEDFSNDKVKRINKQCRSMSKKLKNNQVPKWPQLKKGVRDKARARARERTVEKMRLKALKDPNQGSLAAPEKAPTTNCPSNNNHSCSEQIGSCSAFEHVDSSAQSQSVEELIHAEWEENENARFYSSYMFNDATQEYQHVLNSGINLDEQSPDTISFMSSASQIFTNQLCLSTTTSTNECIDTINNNSCLFSSHI